MACARPPVRLKPSNQSTREGRRLSDEVDRALQKLDSLLCAAESRITDTENHLASYPLRPTEIDHGGLVGLADDDHTQYLLVDGTRPMAGNLDMGGFDITNVGLVDGVDVSDHGSRHAAAGADPLTLSASDRLLGRLTAGAGAVEELTAAQVGPWVQGSVDHGSLLGLADDDHTQYLLADGTRPLTGDWNVGGFDITNVFNLDLTNRLRILAAAARMEIGNNFGIPQVRIRKSVSASSPWTWSTGGSDETDDKRVLFHDDETLRWQTFDGLSWLDVVVMNHDQSVEISGLTYPTTDGAADSVMTTDGLGTLSLATLDSLADSIQHHSLSGLADDDHTQYLLADGSRALAGNWSAGGNNITNVGLLTVDTQANIGNGTASPVLALNKSDAGNASIAWRVAGVNRFIAQLTAGEALQFFRYDAGGVLQDHPLDLFSSGLVRIGEAGQLTEVQGDLDVLEDLTVDGLLRVEGLNAIIHNARTGNGYLLVDSSDAGTASVGLRDDGTERFTIRLTSSGDSTVFYARDNTGSVAHITTYTHGSGTWAFPGSATVTNTLTASGLTYPTADGAANDVMITDGAGTLSLASLSDLLDWEVHVAADDFRGVTDGAGGAEAQVADYSGIVGQRVFPTVQFPDSSEDNASAMAYFRLPQDYAGGSLVVRVTYFVTVANAADQIYLAAAFDRVQDATAGADTDSYDTATALTDTPAGSSDWDYVDIEVAPTRIDGLLAGEDGILRLTRDPTNIDDTVAGTVYVTGARIFEAAA